MDVFWYGVFGGLAVNILRLIELIHLPQEQRPATFTDPLYIVQFVSLPLMGGVLAYAYQTSGTALSLGNKRWSFGPSHSKEFRICRSSLRAPQSRLDDRFLVGSCKSCRMKPN